MAYRKWLTTAHYRQALLRCDTVLELDAAFIHWSIYNKDKFLYSDILELIQITA